MIRRLVSTCYAPRPGDSAIRQVAVIPGDGIGLEIVSSTLDILKSVHAPLQFKEFPDLHVEDKATISELKQYKCALKGTLSSMVGEGPGSPNLALRKILNVYGDLVHAFSIPGIKTRHENLDIIVIRENLEGEYSGLEHEVYPGVIESIKVITKAGSLRIAEYAFEVAFLNNRKRVTAVHKANIMKMVDGEFLKAVREVAARYPSIEYKEMIVDNASMQMASNPWQFDVMVLPNLYGSILANIASFLVGGPGITPGVNIGPDFALFEPGTRHIARDIGGKGIANPTAMILSSSMMLRHMNLPHFADRIQNGVFKTIAQGKVLTKDIGGDSTTYEFTKEIIKNISTY
jgi:Isocitrate/isopropylmalate dehydrogenase